VDSVDAIQLGAPGTRRIATGELMEHTFQTEGTLEELLKAITALVREMSDDEKAAFRQPWLDYVAEKERTKNYDRRFLQSCGVDPGGD
jgi:hypothetical protein